MDTLTGTSTGVISHLRHPLAAREMDKAFSEVPAQQSCRNLARIIDSIGNTTIQKYTQADDEYDRMTRNGETRRRGYLLRRT